MDIRTFLQVKDITRKEFAQMVGITPGHLDHLITEDRLASVKLIARIEKVTNGLVTRNDLRPEFREISNY